MEIESLGSNKIWFEFGDDEVHFFYGINISIFAFWISDIDEIDEIDYNKKGSYLRWN